jgi:thioredoxin 1
MKPFTVKGLGEDKNCLKKFWHGSWLYGSVIKTTKKMNRTISKKEFRKEVIDNMNLSLVQFKLEWSGACQIISPIYEELATSYKGQANFFTVDVEKETGLDDEYGVMELPTILFFKSGKVIDHLIGLASKSNMISKIENVLSNRLNLN